MDRGRRRHEGLTGRPQPLSRTCYHPEAALRRRALICEVTHLLQDTHAHLDALEFAGDLDGVLARAREAGLDRILTVGSDLESSREAVGLAHRHEMVYAAVGMHPHDAERFGEEQEHLEMLLDEEKVVAVGEIGLDYHRSTSPRRVQLEVFRRQLQWARNHDLPVSVHNREADDDVMAEMRSAGVRGILHCFSGTADTAARALEGGFVISFAGNITFPKSGELRRVAAEVPAGSVLIETDSPVLAPQGRRGRRNEPGYLTQTLDMIAELRATEPAQLEAVLTNTSNALFAWGAR